MATGTHDAAPPALVIGAGSIGRRHVRLLEQLGREVRTVSRRTTVGDFDDIGDAISACNPDYVVLATETDQRGAAITALLGTSFAGRLLVEKPLGSVPAGLPDAPWTTVVGYNLRFHPVIAALRTALRGARVLSMQVRAGQHLPDWRPDRDYRDTASAGAGGGVLRDLSHEIDLVEWLVGPCRSVAAFVGNVSDLELPVEDVVAALVRCDRAPIVTLELNYFDRPAARTIVVATTEHTLRADLIDGTLVVDGAVVSTCSPHRDDTYLALHRAVLSGETDPVCSLAEGRRVMDVIEGIEAAAASGQWVEV